jgi:ferredoxin
MARVRVDPVKCQAYGTCAEVAPTVYEIDEWGYAQTTRRELTDATEVALAEDGLEACPLRAIRVIS